MSAVKLKSRPGKERRRRSSNTSNNKGPIKKEGRPRVLALQCLRRWAKRNSERILQRTRTPIGDEAFGTNNNIDIKRTVVRQHGMYVCWFVFLQ
jgi:hypothetical protein